MSTPASAVTNVSPSKKGRPAAQAKDGRPKSEVVAEHKQLVSNAKTAAKETAKAAGLAEVEVKNIRSKIEKVAARVVSLTNDLGAAKTELATLKTNSKELDKAFASAVKERDKAAAALVKATENQAKAIA